MAALAFVFDERSAVFVTTIRKIVVTKNVIVSDVIFCRVCAYNVFISIARRMVKLCVYIIFNIIFNCNIN